MGFLYTVLYFMKLCGYTTTDNVPHETYTNQTHIQYKKTPQLTEISFRKANESGGLQL